MPWKTFKGVKYQIIKNKYICLFNGDFRTIIKIEIPTNNQKTKALPGQMDMIEN